MTVFTYVIEHDLGFAPNPFHDICTLACCKPLIRKRAKEGDYILGMGAAKPGLGGHLCYWMRVEEIVSFDKYWSDIRFRPKRPNMLGTTYLRYGDNIYHRVEEEGGFKQEFSFHSRPDGTTSIANLERDTGTTDRVLISKTFAYWGRSGIKLPDSLQCFVIRGPGHKSRFSDSQIANLLAWLDAHPERGYQDEPAHWQYLDRKRKRVGVATSR